jgi:CheY-like chemotaxis protein
MSARRRGELMRALPYARRFARALTGSQERGDALVAAALPGVLAAESAAADGECEDARLALYAALAERCRAVGGGSGEGAGGATPASLSAVQRQLLLLTALEELSVEQAAAVLGLAPDAAAIELAEARQHLLAASATSVLIIEDEPIIAMDIEELVRGCGHTVVGVAGTEAEAVEVAERHRPGLILADINLGPGGDGQQAVARIMRHHYAPVIFVTAYPERLLTGDAVEPAFVITKPFEPMALAIATYQAVTGGLPVA